MKWIEQAKEAGKSKIKAEKYGEAIDEYMKCLLALDFKTVRGRVPKDAEMMSDVAVKIPVLNNMALCLAKNTHYERAVKMLDALLEIDEFNAKALARRLSYLE